MADHATNEHGFCPHCLMSMDGADIVQTFIGMGDTEEIARKRAEDYGYRPGHTKWGRAIGIVDPIRDRVSLWKCPDCGHTWDR